jgi:hypothetical protein
MDLAGGASSQRTTTSCTGRDRSPASAGRRATCCSASSSSRIGATQLWRQKSFYLTSLGPTIKHSRMQVAATKASAAHIAHNLHRPPEAR